MDSSISIEKIGIIDAKIGDVKFGLICKSMSKNKNKYEKSKIELNNF